MKKIWSSGFYKSRISGWSPPRIRIGKKTNSGSERSRISEPKRPCESNNVAADRKHRAFRVEMHLIKQCIGGLKISRICVRKQKQRIDRIDRFKQQRLGKQPIIFSPLSSTGVFVGFFCLWTNVVNESINSCGGRKDGNNDVVREEKCRTKEAQNKQHKRCGDPNWKHVLDNFCLTQTEAECIAYF